MRRERGGEFNHESDWDMDGRYADDIQRAHDMARIRKEKEAKEANETAERWEREHQGARPSRAAPRFPIAAIAKKEYVTNWKGDT